jgi:hypothetical protein
MCYFSSRKNIELVSEGEYLGMPRGNKSLMKNAYILIGKPE